MKITSVLLRPFSGVYNDVFKTNLEVSNSADPVNKLHGSQHLVKQLIFSTAIVTALTSIVASVVISKALKK
jgi:hypothetical protein